MYSHFSRVTRQWCTLYGITTLNSTKKPCTVEPRYNEQKSLSLPFRGENLGTYSEVKRICILISTVLPDSGVPLRDYNFATFNALIDQRNLVFSFQSRGQQVVYTTIRDYNPEGVEKEDGLKLKKGEKVVLIQKSPDPESK